MLATAGRESGFSGVSLVSIPEPYLVVQGFSAWLVHYIFLHKLYTKGATQTLDIFIWLFVQSIK